jgi:hypothetical protein
MKAGGLGPYKLIRPTISLEMPVPSQGLYGFPRNFDAILLKMELNEVTIQNLKYCTIGLMTFARY